MQVSIANAEKEKELMPEVETTPLPEEDIEAFFAAYADSLEKAGNHEKNYRLKEVTIKAKKRTKEKAEGQNLQREKERRIGSAKLLCPDASGVRTDV
jgi:hypothetical protein